MGKLIDTDVLKQELYQQWFMDILLTQKSGEDMFYALAQKIDEQPTTYDPDKVVEQLKKLGKECEDPLQDYDPNYFIEKSIKIVKGGGIE